jgi:hypothetical protein
VAAPLFDTSTDGVLYASVDVENAGVFLTITKPVGSPDQHSLTRTVDGVTVPVRSGDPVWTTGGYGMAFDQEAPLGLDLVYTATPLGAGTPSTVAVQIPEPVGLDDVWIKSAEDPNLAARVYVVDWPELLYTSRRELTTVHGSRHPIVTSDVYSSPTSQMQILVYGPDVPTIRTLLIDGDVLLIQTKQSYARPDEFVVPGDVSEALAGPVSEPSRVFTFPVIPVARPATAGQPLWLPGWSWDDLSADYATWDDVTAAFADMTSLASDGKA